MSFEFNRSNIDHYLYLVAKEYKKQNRLNPEAEIIMVNSDINCNGIPVKTERALKNQSSLFCLSV